MPWAGWVLSGTLAEHNAVDPMTDVPILRVITDFGQLTSTDLQKLQVLSQRESCWIMEDALRRYNDGDLAWPTPQLIGAAGDMAGLTEIAQWFGTTLAALGIQGVFGCPAGILSDIALPWLGSHIRIAAQQGFEQAGIQTAWAISPETGAEPEWWLSGAGRIVPWRTGLNTPAQWYWVAVKDFPNIRKSCEALPPPPHGSPARATIEDRLNRLRATSIQLIDDPTILPFPSDTQFVVVSPQRRLQRRVAELLNHKGRKDGPIVYVWIDMLPDESHNGLDVVVVYAKPSIIGLAPPHAVKIQVFDTHDTVWTALWQKLIGRGLWEGRTPWRLDQPERATHAAHYSTEQPHPGTDFRWLETQSGHEVMRQWIHEEQQAIGRIAPAIPVLDRVLTRLVDTYRRGGRIFYVGAGSAGRLAVMDAAELPPTFGLPAGRVQAILAGGMSAFQQAQEDAEDGSQAGCRAIRARGITSRDVVMGVTAHGDTPYVVGALQEAKMRGGFTVALVNNQGTRVATVADEVIFVDTGPEILLGSTRLKAGTVEKVVLNMLSTLTMVKTGHSYDNLMVNFMAQNDKLRERAVRVLMMATGQPRQIARRTLQAAQGNLPVAIIMLRCGLSSQQAQNALDRHGSVWQTITTIEESGEARLWDTD